ncbi:hypothetical protein KA005_61880 [bacterium]|nr:hypothetical protein [bacterium]
MIFRKEDEKKFEQILGKDCWDDTVKENSIIAVNAYEANYGLYDEREEFTEAGLTFYGNHGAGDNYGDIAFACYKGEDVEINADRDGTPVATVLPDGSVPPNEKENAIKFWDIYKQAKEYTEGVHP